MSPKKTPHATTRLIAIASFSFDEYYLLPAETAACNSFELVNSGAELSEAGYTLGDDLFDTLLKSVMLLAVPFSHHLESEHSSGKVVEEQSQA